MAITGTISLQSYPLVPGATTAVQPLGLTAPTFGTPPVQREQDTLTYTSVTSQVTTLLYQPTMMTAGNLVSEFRAAGINDATLNRFNQLVLPSGSTLTGTGTSAAYLGF